MSPHDRRESRLYIFEDEKSIVLDIARFISRHLLLPVSPDLAKFCRFGTIFKNWAKV